MALHSVGRLDEFEPDSLTRVLPAGVPVCLARLLTGEMHAVSDICSHEEIELSDGLIDGLLLECPAHGSRFDLLTGAATSFPADQPIATYPVTIADGEVFVEVGPTSSDVEDA